MDSSAELIERQRIIIILLCLALFIACLYTVLETRRERAASRAAGVYLNDLSQEREDRKLDLLYTRGLEDKLDEYEGRGRGVVTLSENPEPQAKRRD